MARSELSPVPATVRKVFIAYQSTPPIIADLAEAFGRRGISADFFHADENTLFDRFIIRRANKLAHSLRLIPKSRTLFAAHPSCHRNFRSQGLQDALNATDADFAFIIRGWSYRRECLKAKIPLLGWWVEADRRLPEVLPEVADYDHMYFMNLAGVEAARKNGCAHVSYLPHAVNQRRFRRLEGVERDIDVVFVGGWSRKRETYLAGIREVTSRIAIYGPKWISRAWRKPKLLACVRGAHIEGEELTRLYNRSRIVLNITNWDGLHGQPPSGLNMRAVEVAACGSFFLTDPVLELDETFGTAAVATYRDSEDLPQQVAYWLSHAEERARYADNLHRSLDRRFTYDAMVDTLLADYQQIVSEGKQ